MRRILSVLLALCMAAGLLCAAAVPAYAEEAAPELAAVIVNNVEDETDPTIWELLWEMALLLGSAIFQFVEFLASIASFISSFLRPIEWLLSILLLVLNLAVFILPVFL